MKLTIDVAPLTPEARALGVEMWRRLILAKLQELEAADQASALTPAGHHGSASPLAPRLELHR